MTAIFVTGTGTDIGKTYIAAGLLRHWQTKGRAVDALKPVVTGFDLATAETCDPGVLLCALGRPVTPTEVERISPWRFSTPVAPDLAARREDRTIDFQALVNFCRRSVAARHDALLIEGVGGIMVPLDGRHTVLDWMLAVDIPLVLVTGSYLGAISHTLTALDVLSHRGLSVKALVINETLDSPVTMQNTTQSIANFAPSLAIIGMRRTLPETPDSDNFERLAQLL
jgi:dethiobiotin synthetase